jgi:hypothetical protein
MVGDRDLLFPRESYSQFAAPEVNDRVWGMARALGYEDIFVERISTAIDDHIPLIGAGFKIVDVIDLEYPHHHTTQDTLDKVSAESLTIAGRVALALIRAEEP